LYSLLAHFSAIAVRVRAFGRDVPTTRVEGGTWLALVGIDLAVVPGTYTVAVEAVAASGSAHTSVSLKVQSKHFGTRALTVDQAFVEPPPEMQDRIRAEAEELGRLFAEVSADRLWQGPFALPVPGATASRFGTRSIFNGAAGSPHSGADFRGALGTPVLAPASGRVVLARDLYFSGNTVVLDHGQGLYSLLAHFSAIAVRVGDAISAGQEVGQVGATGRVTGPHLHWAIRLGGARVDPLALIAVLE
jgi:murein DD-endopeptidase MepM/ murein hydrolase activator NlpD